MVCSGRESRKECCGEAANYLQSAAESGVWTTIANHCQQPQTTVNSASYACRLAKVPRVWMAAARRGDQGWPQERRMQWV